MYEGMYFAVVGELPYHRVINLPTVLRGNVKVVDEGELVDYFKKIDGVVYKVLVGGDLKPLYGVVKKNHLPR